MSRAFSRHNLHCRTLSCFFTLFLLVALADARSATTAPGPTAPRGETGIAFMPATLVAQNFPGSEETAPSSLQITPKQRRDLQKMRFEKMKKDAGELASLADSLKDDVDKSSENILSLEIVEKAEKIEKLAKRIKKAAKGD
jgi:hypothetical protein